MMPRPTLDAPRLRPSAPLARVPGLHVTRRGSRVLVVEPETAGWLVLSHAEWRVLGLLDRPRTVGDVGRAAAPATPDPAALLQRLHRAGMLEVEGRRFADPRTLWAPPPDEIRFVSIHVVDGCNLRCRYCYADAGSVSRRMSPALLRTVIERCLRELPAPSLTIDFLGGEPLLAFDDLVDAVRHGQAEAERLGKAVEFILQTNGLLLTPERARTLAGLSVGVGVSIDGPAALHDRHRVHPDGAGTQGDVLANLLRARDEGLRVAPLAVIHDPSTYREVVDFFIGHGFEFLRLNPATPLGRARDLEPISGREPEAFARGLLDAARHAHAWCERHGRTLRIQDLDHMLMNLSTRERGYMCMRSPCGLGRSIIAFGPEGEVHACEEVERATRSLRRPNRSLSTCGRRVRPSG